LSAVDLGGTKLALGLVDDTLGIIARTSGPAVTESPEACLDNLYSRLDQAVADTVRSTRSASAPLRWSTFAAGRIVLSTNLPLRDVSLRDLLTESYGVPVVVDNDATWPAWPSFATPPASAPAR